MIPFSGNLQCFFCTTIVIDGPGRSVERDADKGFLFFLLLIFLSFSNGEGGGVGMGPLVASTHFYTSCFFNDVCHDLVRPAQCPNSFCCNMVANHSSILSDESHLHFFYWRKSILYSVPSL